MCEEDGSCPISTFIVPNYIGKVKSIFLINFVMIYNDYSISKFMSLNFKLIQEELLQVHSSVLYDGYFKFYLVFVLSLFPILIVSKISNIKE